MLSSWRRLAHLTRMPAGFVLLLLIAPIGADTQLVVFLPALVLVVTAYKMMYEKLGNSKKRETAAHRCYCCPCCKK